MTTTKQQQVRAYVDDSRIVIQAPYRLKDTIKALPGARWNALRRQWSVPATPGAARAVVEALTSHGLRYTEEFHAFISQAQVCEMIKELPKSQLPPIPLTKTKPWHHQTQGVWFMAKIFGDKVQNG